MSDLLVDRDGRVALLTLNRPGKRNALSRNLLDELTAAVADFEADSSQDVLVITGAGDIAFCAGADMKEMNENNASQTRLPISRVPDIAGIGACQKVTIAAVNGLAVSGGFELALSCDIRVAADNAWFGLFEVKRGILAGVAVSLLPRLVSYGVAADMLLSADRLEVEDAHRLGLIQQVVPRAELTEIAMAKAAAVSSNSQTAVWGTKQVLRLWRDALLTEQQKYYEAVVHRVLLSGDMHEGARAFVEKREPRFANRWPDPFQ
jgi:enoyl-CoA hydratase/carnithine racemase